MRLHLPERAMVVRDDEALYYDDEILITRDAAWTAVEIPLVPYGFRSRVDRLGLGWQTTGALAALREGELRVKVARRPFDADRWERRVDEHVARVGNPSEHWPEWRAAQARNMEAVQASTKHVVILRRLGGRTTAAQWNSRIAKGPIPPVGPGEIATWHKRARAERDAMARSGFDAVPVDAPTLRWLRRHALTRGLTPPRPSATGRRVWTRDEIVDEFGDVTLTPLAKGLRVDSPLGTTYTATLVASAFPIEMRHPETPPWLAHLDWIGPWAEADLSLTLVPPRKAKGDILKRYRLAQDQHHDAAEAGADLPIETQEMHALAREMEHLIPRRRLPLVYGWARIHVDATSEDELAYRVARVIERYADEDSPQIDLALPTGMAQVDLLLEGIPGQPVRHQSWRQRWTVEAIGCGLPQAGSNLGHSTGLYVGPTTGRYVQAVTLDLHQSITRREVRDIEGPGGFVCLGAQRSGKSSAFGTILDDATERGTNSICLDFSGPLARLADLPRHAGRVQVLNLTKMGDGLLDPMGQGVIPGDDRAAREERKRLTRDTLTLLAWRAIERDDETETALLRAITEEADERWPGLAGVIRRLSTASSIKAQALAERLEFDLAGPEGELLLAPSPDAPALLDEPVTRIITAPGLPLPAAGLPIERWMPAQSLGAATFSIAAHLAHRLLWDLEPWRLKMLLVDEAHVAMGTEAGRRVIEQALRDGPKHGVVVGLATHNAVDLSDERITNAIATKMLFRSTADAELTAAIRVAGLEDSPATRRQITGLRNGECIMVTAEDIRDRVQWHLHDEELRETLRTTPKGAA